MGLCVCEGEGLKQRTELITMIKQVLWGETVLHYKLNLGFLGISGRRSTRGRQNLSKRENDREDSDLNEFKEYALNIMEEGKA